MKGIIRNILTIVLVFNISLETQGQITGGVYFPLGQNYAVCADGDTIYYGGDSKLYVVERHYNNVTNPDNPPQEIDIPWSGMISRIRILPISPTGTQERTLYMFAAYGLFTAPVSNPESVQHITDRPTLDAVIGPKDNLWFLHDVCLRRADKSASVDLITYTMQRSSAVAFGDSIWVGLANGIAVIDPVTLKLVKYNSIGNGHTVDIMKDNTGNLWIAESDPLGRLIKYSRDHGFELAPNWMNTHISYEDWECAAMGDGEILLKKRNSYFTLYSIVDSAFIEVPGGSLSRDLSYNPIDGRYYSGGGKDRGYWYEIHPILPNVPNIFSEVYYEPVGTIEDLPTARISFFFTNSAQEGEVTKYKVTNITNPLDPQIVDEGVVEPNTYLVYRRVYTPAVLKLEAYRCDTTTLLCSKTVMETVIATANTTGVAIGATLPRQYALKQNYPNPFNPETTIEFDLPEPGVAEIRIFDIRGVEVRTLARSLFAAGSHSVVWNGKDNTGMQVNSGTYLYVLKSRSFTQTKKMILVK